MKEVTWVLSEGEVIVIQHGLATSRLMYLVNTRNTLFPEEIRNVYRTCLKEAEALTERLNLWTGHEPNRKTTDLLAGVKE